MRLAGTSLCVLAVEDGEEGRGGMRPAKERKRERGRHGGNLRGSKGKGDSGWRAAGYKCFRYQLGLAANPAYPSIPQCGDINYEILR